MDQLRGWTFLPNTFRTSSVGQPAGTLPTPSLILNRKVIKKNCNTLLETIDNMGLGFRAHVKA